jgi:hypothetical protein
MPREFDVITLDVRTVNQSISSPAGSVSVEAWSCDAEWNKGGLSAGHGS